jgi:UDP:flavonoid glycosyltransferase YjiC (YdhE family)
MAHRTKIFFFAHAVTMAHFSRPLKWIEGLDTRLYDVYLASHQKFKGLSPKVGVTFLELGCIDAVKFENIVINAEPIYDSITFEKHIQEDIGLMDAIKPDIVIGDFRHSLSVSCRVKKIPYINLTNAYWHPSTKLKFPLPEAPIVRLLGEAMSNFLLAPFLPIAMRLNFFMMTFTLRRSFERAGLRFTDYRKVITDGDITLYCDTPELIPLNKQLTHEHFVGPLIWSMPVEVPGWWKRLNSRKRRIFLTLGSSGPAHSLPMILRALAKLDVEIIVALAGKQLQLPEWANVFVTDYLPMGSACQNSSLVICNGGSPLVHTALSYGVPTIGIVCNNDQLLNMAHIQQRGAGLLMRYWSLSEEKLTTAVTEILSNPRYLQQSRRIQSEFERIDVKARLQNVINQITCRLK